MEPQEKQAFPEKRRKRGRRWYFYGGLVLLLLALLAGGFLLFMTVTEYRPEPVEAAAAGGAGERPVFAGEELSILSFNTGYTSLGREADFLMDGGRGSGQTDENTVRENMAGIQETLGKYDADVYMFQEIDENSRRTFGINQLEAYGEVLPEYGWYYAPNYRCRFVPYPLQHPFGAIDSGVATYSRYRAEEPLRISLPNPFSWPVRTANLKRCMLELRLPIEGREEELVIINFHLEAYDSGEGKEAQTGQLLSLIEEEYEKGNYVIAGGDFNQMFPEVDTVVKPSSRWVPGRLEPLPEELEGWRYVYDDSVPTCRLLNQPLEPQNELTQFYVIDGFILSPNLEAEEIRTMDEGFTYTDHNPVLLTVSLAD